MYIYNISNHFSCDFFFLNRCHRYYTVLFRYSFDIEDSHTCILKPLIDPVHRDSPFMKLMSLTNFDRRKEEGKKFIRQQIRFNCRIWIHEIPLTRTLYLGKIRVTYGTCLYDTVTVRLTFKLHRFCLVPVTWSPWFP